MPASGAAAAGARQVSADGHELRFAVNYLAGFLLTRLLLPQLRENAPARIVNVASAGQQAIDFDDVMLTHGYSGSRAYCQSKLAQILFTVDLAAELEGTGVTVNALHPATYMNTTMVRQAGVTPWSTVEQGAEAILNLATSAALADHSGLYFDGLREARAQAQAYDPDARARLRALSFALTGLSRSGAALRSQSLWGAAHHDGGASPSILDSTAPSLLASIRQNGSTLRRDAHAQIDDQPACPCGLLRRQHGARAGHHQDRRDPALFGPVRRHRRRRSTTPSSST